MAAKLSEASKLMEEDMATFFNVMLAEQKGFDRSLDELKFQVGAFAQHVDLSRVDQVYAAVGQTEAAIADAKARATQFASREELFSVDERTDYELIEQVCASLCFRAPQPQHGARPPRGRQARGGAWRHAP